MAIQDDLIYPGGSGNIPPAQNLPYIGGLGYDLNADFGNGQNARKALQPGQTGEMVMRVDIDATFTIGTGAPIAQFHAVLSETGSPTVLSGLNDFVIIGSSLGPMNTSGNFSHAGYVAADLVAGESFFIRLNPWTNAMSRCLANADINVQDLRYLGLMISVPNAEAAASPFFDGGLATMSLVLTSDISWDPADFQYPSGVNII